MKRSKLAAIGLVFAGSIGLITYAAASGIFPDYPVVGSATYCAGSSSTVSGTYTGSQTGCPNQVPAGPTIVTGNEQIPADTRLANGVAPATVLIPMASLNALPIQFVTVTGASPAGISAANNSGGVCYNAGSTITAANITLPLAPIDGQQYKVCASNTITTLSIAAATGSSLAVSTPTVLTASTTAPQGYAFIYNAATTKWFRLQ
jgi:hypothetical protein